MKHAQHIEKAILLTPLFVAFAWLGVTVLRAGSDTGGAALSPGKLDALVTALFVFIVAYALLLAGLFYSMSRSVKKHPLHAKK